MDERSDLISLLSEYFKAYWYLSCRRGRGVRRRRGTSFVAKNKYYYLIFNWSLSKPTPYWSIIEVKRLFFLKKASGKRAVISLVMGLDNDTKTIVSAKSIKVIRSDCRRSFLVSSLQSVLFFSGSLFALLRRKLPLDHLESMHCIPCTCTGILILWFFWQSLALLGLLWDLFCTLRTHHANLSCCPQISLARCLRSPGARGTTKWVRLYLFASVDEGWRLNNWEDYQKDITVGIG